MTLSENGMEKLLLFLHNFCFFFAFPATKKLATPNIFPENPKQIDEIFAEQVFSTIIY